MSLGQNIRKVRNFKNIPLKELALKTGLQKTTLINIESDKHQPRIDTLKKIASALGEKESYFFADNLYLSTEVPTEENL